jgi:hypothetical protein
MKRAVEWKMAVCLGEDLAAAEQQRYAVRRFQIVAGNTGVFETMSNGVVAEEEFIDKFA